MKIMFGLIFFKMSFLISSLYAPALSITKALGISFNILGLLDIKDVPYNLLFSFEVANQ